MWGGYAHGEWYLRENSRPPCRQQVRSRSDLLNFDCASGRRPLPPLRDRASALKHGGLHSKFRLARRPDQIVKKGSVFQVSAFQTSVFQTQKIWIEAEDGDCRADKVIRRNRLRC